MLKRLAFAIVTCSGMKDQFFCGRFGCGTNPVGTMLVQLCCEECEQFSKKLICAECQRSAGADPKEFKDSARFKCDKCSAVFSAKVHGALKVPSSSAAHIHKTKHKMSEWGQHMYTVGNYKCKRVKKGGQLCPMDVLSTDPKIITYCDHCEKVEIIICTECRELAGMMSSKWPNKVTNKSQWDRFRYKARFLCWKCEIYGSKVDPTFKPGFTSEGVASKVHGALPKPPLRQRKRKRPSSSAVQASHGIVCTRYRGQTLDKLCGKSVSVSSFPLRLYCAYCAKNNGLGFTGTVAQTCTGCQKDVRRYLRLRRIRDPSNKELAFKCQVCMQGSPHYATVFNDHHDKDQKAKEDKALKYVCDLLRDDDSPRPTKRHKADKPSPSDQTSGFWPSFSSLKKSMKKKMGWDD